MNYIKSFKVFENLNNPKSIEQFLEEIRMPQKFVPSICNWWNQNRSNIIIHHFEFTKGRPIMGVALSGNEIAMNKRFLVPPHMKLFQALHESKHCDQEREMKYSTEHFNAIVSGDKEQFLKNYLQLEREANNYAINSMKEMGLGKLIEFEEIRLRATELAGDMVFNDMREDIKKYNSTNLIDLFKKQIL